MKHSIDARHPGQSQQTDAVIATLHKAIDQQIAEARKKWTAARAVIQRLTSEQIPAEEEAEKAAALISQLEAMRDAKPLPEMPQTVGRGNATPATNGSPLPTTKDVKKAIQRGKDTMGKLVARFGQPQYRRLKRLLTALQKSKDIRIVGHRRAAKYELLT